MIPLYTTDQIREVDSFAINSLQVPGIVLMENASLEILKFIEIYTEKIKSKKFGIICGKGNNGGDGMAVARHLINTGYPVKVIYLGNAEEMSEDCRINFRILKNIEPANSKLKLFQFKSLSDLNKFKDCNIIIDALLGSGTAGKLKEPYPGIIKKLNSKKAYKIAIDIPTGLNANTGSSEDSFVADLTITLGEFKLGLFIGNGALVSGIIEKGNIGIPGTYYSKLNVTDYLIEPEDAITGLPVKKKDLNKYSAGKVLTIAGSGKLPGAAILSSKAALSIGAGASILAFPESVRSFVKKKLVEVIVETYDDSGTGYLNPKNINTFKSRIDWADVIAMGPGLGREAGTLDAVRKILTKFKSKKMVIDADALFALNKIYKDFDLKNKILTPHHGEFAALIGKKIDEIQNDLLNFGKKFSSATGAYLVLKGSPTIIFNPEGEALINTTGTPALAKFGTGDVLTGVIAGLLAQQDDIEKAVVSGVYLHSLSADLLVKNKTEYSILAGDLVNHIPESIKFLRKSIA